MKKTISTVLLSAMFGLASVIPASAAPISAPVRGADFEEFFALDGDFEFAEPANSTVIKPCRAGTFRVRNNTTTKRKLLNSAIAGGIGAAVGGGIGGKRGALLGLGGGAGGYLIYRYVKDRNGRCVPRYVRRG